MAPRLTVFRRGFAAALALVLVQIPSAREAAAVVRTWNNPAGGNASTASNWTPAAVPAPGDVLTFDLNSTYTTSFNATTSASLAMSLRDGIVSLSFSSPHTFSQSFQIADTAQDTLTAKITSGTLNGSGPVLIAPGFPSRGTLEVRGGTTILDLSGANADLSVGTSGNGTLDVLAGGSVQISDDVYVGPSANSAGFLRVSGRSVTPPVPSNLTTTTATGDIIVGWRGYGEFDVESFGTVFCSGNFYIAPEEHSFFDGNGIVTVGEASGTSVATLTVDRDLWIGGGFGGVAGNGTMNVFKNGRVQVNGTTHLGGTTVGNPDAILHIERPGLLDAGGSLRTGSLSLDESATLDFDSGSIFVDGGTFENDGNPFTVNSDVTSLLVRPKLILTNGATASLPDTGFPAPSLTAGTTGVGEVQADSGAGWTLDADLVLGEFDGGFGILTLLHGGTLDAPSQHVRVGIEGTGQVDMSTAGRLTCGNLHIGTDADGAGVVTVHGSDTSILATSRITIGAHAASVNPVAILSLTDSGTVEAMSAGAAITVEDNAKLAVSSFAQATAMNGSLWNDGLVVLSDGFINVDSLYNFSAGELTGDGFIAGDVRNEGLVSPGSSAGKLDLASSFAQTSSGTLAIELGKHSAGEWDTLAVAGAASLAGTLELTTLPTFVVEPGDAFIILTCGSRTGTFSTVTLNGAPLSGSQFSIDYTPTLVYLKAQQATDAPATAAFPLALELVGRRTASGAFFELSLPADAQARLSVYDVAGRELRVLRDAPTSAGRHRFELGGSGAGVASGVYFGRAIVTLPGAAPEARTARVAIVR